MSRIARKRYSNTIIFYCRIRIKNHKTQLRTDQEDVGRGRDPKKSPNSRTK